MERDHRFEQKMRQAYVHLGQLGISKIAREEHEKALEAKKILESVQKWMREEMVDGGVDSDGMELFTEIEWFLARFEGEDGD